MRLILAIRRAVFWRSFGGKFNSDYLINLPQSVGPVFKAGLIAVLLIICLGAEYLHRCSLPWRFLNQIRTEVFAAFQAADVQWLIFICISVYFVGFIWLDRSWNRGDCSETQVEGHGSEKSHEPTCCERSHQAVAAVFYRQHQVFNHAPWRDVPLFIGIVLYAICALAYGLRYNQSSMVTDTLVLCFGSTLFFSFRLWRSIEAKRSQSFNVAGVVFGFMLILFCIGAVWRPETSQSFQYRGQSRWSGLWENPNRFGMLMGVGLIVAVGLLVSGIRYHVSGRENTHPTTNLPRRTSYRKSWRWVKVVLILAAVGLCGWGLVKSYSRGAWLGTVCGLAYLAYQVARYQVSGLKAFVSWFRKNWLLTSVLLVSVLVLAFWNFRHSEHLVARRAFSVGNVNDFSWRNRLTAWEGAMQMMSDKPWLGYGWKQPHQVYERYYRPAQVDEGGAIQLNDYFTLATTLGIPALGCFVAFVWFNLVRSPLSKVSRGSTVTTSHGPRTTDYWPKAICRAGVAILLVGFWFDGGLFKLATGATFWILLALGRED